MPDAGVAAMDRRQATDRAMRWVELLASEVGPRRPTGRNERLAAELMREELQRAGVPARIEGFDGYDSFARPFAPILAAATLPWALPPSWRRLREALALLAAAGVVTEGGLRGNVLSQALARSPSQNVVATIEPKAGARRTLCLVCHLDTSRSGLLFHPAVARLLGPWISLQTIAVLIGGTEVALGRLRPGRALLAAARGVAAIGLALLIERELRGEDVAGANDNASGSAVAAQLAVECRAEPLESTRVILLMSGCEEAGTLGAQAFLRGRDTRAWLFLNFDSVGAAATLRFLRREGVITRWRADARLAELADRIAQRRTDLRMAPTATPAGLTYDTSPVLARGGRALTFSTQDGVIPNLHWPTDTYENVDRDGIDRTLQAGREMIAAIDRGEAD